MKVYVLTDSYGEEIVGVYADHDLAVAKKAELDALPANYPHTVERATSVQEYELIESSSV